MKASFLVAIAVGPSLLSCSKPAPATPPPEPTQAPVQLSGAGSSFAAPLLTSWAAAFQGVQPQVRLAYDSVGSAAGIQSVLAGNVDFGASDAPLTDEQALAYLKRWGYGVYHLPAAVGAGVPAYNLPGVQGEVKFTSDALAGIFLGRIKKWNDRELSRANPDLALPNSDIVVVHRSDGSGTTYVWGDYLSKVSAEWKAKVGTGMSLAWPVGIEAKGNEGVSAKIRDTPFSLGYVELIYAIQNKLHYGPVRNSSGSFIKASLASVTDAATEVAQSRPEDYRVSITNSNSKDAYPICGFTWLLVPGHLSNPEKQKAMVDFVSWALRDGQTSAEGLMYARLPQKVIANERQTLRRIQ